MSQVSKDFSSSNVDVPSVTKSKVDIPASTTPTLLGAQNRVPGVISVDEGTLEEPSKLSEEAGQVSPTHLSILC